MFRTRAARQSLIMGVVGVIAIVVVGLLGPASADTVTLYVLAGGWLFGSLMLGIYRS